MLVTVMTQTTPPDKDLPLYSSITDVSNSSLVIKKLEAHYLSMLNKLADIKEEFSLCKLELQLERIKRK